MCLTGPFSMTTMVMLRTVQCMVGGNNNNNNNKPICNVPDASVTDPEARRTLRNITVRVVTT